MTYDLLAQAADADRQADAIFARMHAARGSTGALIPAGFEAQAQEASDFRRRAEWLRAEADELKPRRITLSVDPALTPPPALPHLQPAAGALDPEPDLQAVVARIMKA
ncbi:MAG TPA: hypothetical protein VGD23_04520 [Sphingomicrobium sp.]